MLGNNAHMRLLLVPLVFVLATSCHEAAHIDQIYIRKSGWSAVDITLKSAGTGHFEISGYARKKTGSFSFTPQPFRALRDRLEPFRTQSVPFSDASVREFIIGGVCPKGVPYVTDQGAVYIRWTGPSVDEHYLADLGCDHVRNAARNKELLAIVKSFPVPLNW